MISLTYTILRITYGDTKMTNCTITTGYTYQNVRLFLSSFHQYYVNELLVSNYYLLTDLFQYYFIALSFRLNKLSPRTVRSKK